MSKKRILLNVAWRVSAVLLAALMLGLAPAHGLAAPPPAPAAQITCPCSIWDDSATPGQASVSDSNAIEAGVKFRSSLDGYIVGLRFYKGSLNTGTHVGHLWAGDGTLLAEATFVGETASGWQEVAIDPPVAIISNTTYVASYHTDVGHYAFDGAYFASGVDSPPLRALANGEDGPNGVYLYGAGGFPTQTYNASNYWVDVVFDTTVGPDTTPPAVSSEGVAWGVEPPALPLEPGGTITLTLGDDYYWEEYSNLSVPLPAGVLIYVQVDSADVETTYGAVLEDHEILGGFYNNISGLVYSGLSGLGAGPAEVERPTVSDRPPASSRRLPPRP
jgi:hypothetical protein